MLGKSRKSFVSNVTVEHRERCARAAAFAESLGREIDWSEDHIDMSLPSEESVEVLVQSDAERLAYYRSHGLARCDDYPGGDAKFEEDVLSGAVPGASDCDARPEDDYIIARIRDGRFTFDRDFADYPMSWRVWACMAAHSGEHGFLTSCSHAPSKDPYVLMGVQR